MFVAESKQGIKNASQGTLFYTILLTPFENTWNLLKSSLIN
jgi:hypothetical protein